MNDPQPSNASAFNPATNAQGADQQTLLVVLRRMRKRLAGELASTDTAIGEIESMCVHDFGAPLRCGPKVARTCKRCGAEVIE